MPERSEADKKEYWGYKRGDLRIIHRPAKMVAEVRCPACRKLVSRGAVPGSEQWCPRCKTTFAATAATPRVDTP